VVDGGGALTLASQHADVRLTAVGSGRQVAIGLDTRAGVEWLGSISPGAAAAAAIEIGLAFIRIALPQGQRRMRDLSAEGLASIRSAIALRLDTVCENPSNASRPSARIGLLDLGADRFAVGIAAPFGRIESDRLIKFTGAMAAQDISEIRLSPWRALYAAVPSRQAGQHLLDAAESDGWIVDPADSLLQVEACPGSSGCRSTALDTRRDGRRLARLLPQFGFTGTVHVSGCAKGCAKSGPSDLVLVGADGAYGVVRDGTSLDHPERSVTVCDLASDPGKIFGVDRGVTHD
jgi:precorrin-3B synthase